MTHRKFLRILAQFLGCYITLPSADSEQCSASWFNHLAPTIVTNIYWECKADLVRFKWGLGEVLLKDKFAFKSLFKVLYLRRENCLQDAHFYKQQVPCLKNPFKLDRVNFSTLEFRQIEFPRFFSDWFLPI